ncbi:MAG: leucine-rich repeat domain-containing protein [Clostridia bacterium]|nr:leucine-rich repeat domain-containing protein [Clostridia bacterium]
MKKLFAMLAVLTLLPAFAVALTPEKHTCGDFEYILLKDGIAEIVGFMGKSADLIIPAEVDGYRVTGIGNMAFYDRQDLTGRLEIPEGVTRVGDAAFYNCPFTGELRIPNSMETLGEGAFSWCYSFNGELKIPENLREIGPDAFRLCIGLEGRVAIPAGVESIGEGAFAGCRELTAFTVPKGNKSYKTVKGILFTADGTVLLAAPGGKKMNDYVVPDGVKRIGRSAFQYCGGLNGSITFPDSLTEIGANAFESCVSLTGQLKLPSGLRVIEGVAFNFCTGFTGKLTIPQGVTSIGWGAFGDCTGFTGKLTIPDSVTFIDCYAFEGCTGITSAAIPDSVTEIGEYAFGCRYNGAGYEMIPGFAISCSEGSAAAAYAEENGITVR